MALKTKLLFITGVLLLLSFSTCDEAPSDPEPDEPKLSEVVSITAPSANQTYWNDQAVACGHNQPNYTEQTTWLVNGQPVACTDGELADTLSAGEHSVMARISDEGKAVEAAVTITVKQGFSVSLDRPKSDAEFFVGDEVTCSATVTPEKYTEHLQITVGDNDCTDGQAKLTQAGELTVRAFVSVDNRTEADTATVIAKPVVAGKIYLLTDQGVAGEASGFTATLESGGDVIDTGTASNGSFAIKSDRLSELGSQQVTLSVSGRSSEFYGAKAILPAEELLALVEAKELGFILAPKRWRIRCGPLAGESTTIKLPEAFTRYERDDDLKHYASFYMLVPKQGAYTYRKWLPTDRPLPTAFNRKESAVTITAADSTAFWQETTKVEEKICRGDLLRPATIDEVPDVFDGVQVRSKTVNEAASGAAVSNSNGHIKGGSMGIPIDDFGGSYGQRHELAQVFGFGETSEWVGITSSGQFSGEHDFDHYSVDDVSHIQLYMDTVDLQEEEGIAFGIHQWRRVFDIPSLPDN